MVWMCCVVSALVMLFLSAGPAAAQTAQVAELQGQLQALRQKNVTLRERLTQQRALADKILGKVEQLEGKDITLSQALRSVSERPVSLAPVEGLGDIPTVGGPALTIKGLGEFGYTMLYSENAGPDPEGPTESAFWLGKQDVLMLASLNDRVSFLLEAGWMYSATTPTRNFPPPDTSVQWHLARANLNYAFSDLVNLRIGKMHTALGYYEETGWLQTAIFRPEIYEFQTPRYFGNQIGGWLPVHLVGAEVSGVLPTEGFDVAYNVGIWNGRADDLNDVQNTADRNQFKAVSVRLGFSPYAIEGLTVGTSAYFDKIPNDEPKTGFQSDTDQFDGDIDEILLGWYAAYVQNGIELIGETFWMHHDMKGTITATGEGAAFDSWGGYAQAAYQVEDFTPYYRFEFIELGNGDPYFAEFFRDRDVIRHSLGLRWELFDWNALKIEYSHTAAQGNIAQDENQVALSSSWAF